MGKDAKKKTGPSRQTVQLLVLSLLFLGVLALYIGLRVWNAGAEERAAAQADYVLQAEDIVALSWDYGEGLSFQKSGETWVWAEDSAFPLEESALTGLEETLSALQAQQVIGEPDPLADYGLEEPAMTLTVETGEGTATLLVGDMSGSNYYVTLAEDSGTVYTITSTLISQLEQSLMDLMELPSIPSMSESNVAGVEVALPDGSTYQLTRTTETRQQEVETDTGEVDENGEAILETTTETVTVHTWYLDGEALGEEAAEDYVLELGSLYVSAAAAYRAGEEELAAWGLDRASRLTITLTETGEEGEAVETTLELAVGDPDGSGSYRYVTLDAGEETGPNVYLINAGRLDTLLDPAALLEGEEE